MNTTYSSLKKRLLFWYIGSLLIVAVFTILVIHVFALKNGIYFLILLFFTLAVFGFSIIYKITRSLSYLSSRIRMISSKNLDERIRGIVSNDEIGELAETFNELLDRLHMAFKREQQFIADVAHELKTPLSTQRITLELALSHKRSVEEYCQVIEEAIRESYCVSSTLKNVLDLAWSETPMELNNAETFNLTELLKELLDVAEKMARRKKITIHNKLDNKILIQGVKEKLGRAILNIFDNAIKYSNQGDKIDVTLKKDNDYAYLRIKDQGVGIAEKDLPYVFERFYRGSKTDKIFGSGLGLAIAKAIITAHKGEIKVKSHVENGSVFDIIFPLTHFSS